MIRDRNTGRTFFDEEWREWLLSNGGPSFNQLTPEIIELCGADPVFEGPQPTLTRYQTAAMQGVVQKSDGKWYTNWVAVEMSADAKVATDAQQADSVRADRNSRLADTDWRIIKSAEVGEMPDPDWIVYRQDLRDIPLQATFPWNIVWPTVPEDA